MCFQRTFASIFHAVSAMHIEREHEIATLLQMYEVQQESAACPDRTLLYRAKALLEERLAHTPLDLELVELGHATYRSLGEWHQEIALLRQFLTIPLLSLNEQAWARWHIVDCLALADSNCEAVGEQQAFFQWATSTFPLEDCFFVIADGTQARSWLKIAQGYHWLRLHDQLFDQAQAMAQNRLDRFYCLRTAVHLCLSLGEMTQTRRLMCMLHLLRQEDPTWSEKRWITVEIAVLEIAIAERCGEVSQVRLLAEIAIMDMNSWECHLNKDELTEVGQFRSLCHNIAAPLYRGKHYDLAIPFLQKTIAYHTNPHYAYLWLAGALWQTTHQREDVFQLLRQAAARYDGTGNPWDMFQTIPEFADVQQDPEFLAATIV